MHKKPFDTQQIGRLTTSIVTLCTTALCLVIGIAVLLVVAPRVEAWLSEAKVTESIPAKTEVEIPEWWRPPDVSAIPAGEEGDRIRYGRNLIAHTAEYLGPNGKVMRISNGMNCQNCHLEAGTKIFGNNYSAVAANYPKLRGRSGSVESIERRVNDCIERSLNGTALDNDSKEMKAMVAYIKWVGANVPKGETPKGVGLVELSYLDRPANPENGKIVFERTCVICHGANGGGMLNEEETEWINPPLWGENSYNYGAGLFRLSRFAGYIKANMPDGTTFDKPELTDEEAWDIAAYVNSLPRPSKDLSGDWPDVSKKPVDHPFGPFVDNFSEQQHKYGPFKPILESRKN